jgi:hypothetical protein
MATRAKNTSSHKAVVANSNHAGTVLYATKELKQFVSDIGPRLDDVGLDDAPEGISIWEGNVVTTYDQFNGDYDAFLEGKFRVPNEREWNAIKKQRSPWRYQ